MPELDFMTLVDYGLSVGLLCGLLLPFGGWAFRMVFNTIRFAFNRY